MSLHIPFDNTYGSLPSRFFTRLPPTPVRAPELLQFNRDLAMVLGVQTDDAVELAQVFSGCKIPLGSDPLAQVYAGHQFGGFSPQLGDGRAILLGETVGSDATRRDLQLKGSGRTPYSRNGDGRAWLGPVLREYLVSETMHALGIPTTRALAAVATGETVQRETGLPGAVLTRVAASHLRVGTFQFFYARRDLDGLRHLFNYAVARHMPDAGTPLDFLTHVIDRQASLITHWMSVGFIHGVMNTDNTSISGETIDYGPCAFMDHYHPSTVFSSIDVHGRYAFSNQPNIIVWNMAQLATTLVPLCDNQEEAVAAFTEAVHAMPNKIETQWRNRFGAKIGLISPSDQDMALITGLLECMASGKADFTNTFRALSDGQARDQFTDPEAFDEWEKDWLARVAREPDPVTTMRNANPVFIPRNHRVEQMIQAAVDGDLSRFERMLDILSRPFEDQPEARDLTYPPLPEEVVHQTFCGT